MFSVTVIVCASPARKLHNFHLQSPTPASQYRTTSVPAHPAGTPTQPSPRATIIAGNVAQGCRTALTGNGMGHKRRPKVPCDTQRRHLRGLFVAREHSDKLSREQNAPFRSRERLGRLSREQNAPSRSRDNLGRPFREQNAPFRSRDILSRPLREHIAAFHSRDCRERHTRQPRRFFSELRGLHGNSTGALWALLDAAEVRPEPVGLVIGLSAFRNRHLDG